MKYHSARKDLLKGFGRRCLRSTVRHHSAKGLFALFKESFGNAWWRGRYKEGTSWWRIRDGHWCRSINLDIKCCTHSRPGVVLGQGYKYKPLMSVIGIEHLHYKTGPVPKSSPLVESSSSSRGSIDPSTSVCTGNLVSCLVSCGGFRPWCKKSCYHA
jgi:hypothetical protein